FFKGGLGVLFGGVGDGAARLYRKAAENENPASGKGGVLETGRPGIGGLGWPYYSIRRAPSPIGSSAPIMPQFPARVALVCVLQGVTPNCSSLRRAPGFRGNTSPSTTAAWS